MKLFLLRFKFFMLTMAFGLACVPFVNDLQKRWTVFSIDVPHVQSETPLIVFPKYTDEMPLIGGGGSNGNHCDCFICGCGSGHGSGYGSGYGNGSSEYNKIQKNKSKKDRRK